MTRIGFHFVLPFLKDNDRVWFHPTTYSCQEESNICISRESNLGEQAAHPLHHHDLSCLILTLKKILGGVKSEAASSEILVSPDHLVMKLSKVVHYFETQFRRKTPISGNLFHFFKDWISTDWFYFRSPSAFFN